MATISFLIQSKSNPANIYVRLKDGRKTDLKAKTKLLINPEDWNHEKQGPKSLKNVDYKKLNADLIELKSKIINHYNTSSVPVNILWLKNFLYPIDNSEIPVDLVSYIDYYKNIRKHEISEASIKKFNLIQAKMKRFELYRKSTILIKDINEKFKSDFVEYYKKNGYSKNTMQRELVFIKTFCKHAKTKGVEVSLELESLKLDREKSTFIYLSFDELEVISNLQSDQLTESLENAKDWLIISCFTAQRVSDFMRFKPKMIKEYQGKKLIEFKQVKTGKLVTVPLHPKVIEILEKRNGNFPYPISDQKYNDFIKIVVEKAGLTEMINGNMAITKKTGKKVINKKGKLIDEKQTRKESGLYRKCDLVTSHIGRRSFATNFYGIIPTALLISATGHSTEEMFLAYIGKSSSDKALELAKWF